MDHGSFLRHFLAAEPLLRGYLLASTGNAAEAEDLLQEASTVLWEKFGSYDPSRPFKSWALGVARVQVLKWREGRARTSEVLSGAAIEALSESADELSGELDERRTYLRACLGRLGQLASSVIRLKYLQGLPIADIAHHVRKRVGAVEMALVRARRALRNCIERKIGITSE